MGLSQRVKLGGGRAVVGQASGGVSRRGSGVWKGWTSMGWGVCVNHIAINLELSVTL